MRNQKKILMIAITTFVLPILLSLDSTAYMSNYLAKYKSPEGILFLSYTDTWTEDKLENLYLELINNKHGDEIYNLQEVRVFGEGMASDRYTRGQYNALTNTITLYHGDKYIEPTAFREILSHEYGHHFTYYYLNHHHFPFSKWAKLRGLEDESIQWNAFWNYTSASHQWYPQEIIADDYVLLYGPTSPVDLKDVYSNEAFYLKTQHDNQDISNVLENRQLHRYLEEVTGIPIDSTRIIDTPKFKILKDNVLSFNVTEKENVAYRLNLTFFEKDGSTYTKGDDQEFLTITNEQHQGVITFPLKQINKKDSNEYLEVTIDVLDLDTSIGFQTQPIQVDW